MQKKELNSQLQNGQKQEKLVTRSESHNFAIEDADQKFASITTVILMGHIYRAERQTKTGEYSLVRRKASKFFQMRGIEKSLRTTVKRR